MGRSQKNETSYCEDSSRIYQTWFFKEDALSIEQCLLVPVYATICQTVYQCLHSISIWKA